MVSYSGRDLEQGLIQQLDTVDDKGLIKCEYSTTNILIYRDDGSKYVEYVRRAPPIKFYDIPQDYLHSDIFYICPMDYEVDVNVASILYSLGKTVIVDLGGYGGATSFKHHSLDESYGMEMIKNLCNFTTILKASEEDLRHIAPGRDIDQAAEIFLKSGAKICVFTLGERGSFYKASGEEGVYVGSFKPHSFLEDGRLDFTGAGDSFGAGLVSSYSEKRDIFEAVMYGNAVASLVIERTGGCILSRMPSNDKVMKRIKGLI